MTPTDLIPGRQSAQGRRSALLALVPFLLAAALTAAPPTVVPPPLTRAEQKVRVAALADTYRQFLLDVDPILTAPEKDAFLRLETDAQRDAFIDEFWRRHEKLNGTTNRAFETEYYARLDFVRANFEGATSDRGKTYLIRGEPEDIAKINCPRRLRPVEIWHYSRFDDMPALGGDVYLVFFIPEFQRNYVLWNPVLHGLKGLISHDEMFGERGNDVNEGPIAMDCANAEALGTALRQMSENLVTVDRVAAVTPVNSEAMARLARSMVIPTPGAPKIEAQSVDIAFPASDLFKTDVQFSIVVPREAIQPVEVEGVKVYSVEVTGEVMREGRMWERFHYRFDFPADSGATLPIVVDRLLRSGSYSARIKVADLRSLGEVIVEKSFDVPAPARSPAAEAAVARLEEIEETLVDQHPSIHIVPLPDDILSGMQKIETVLTGNAIQGVEWWLDGRKVASRHGPPYTLDFDFGSVPQMHRIRVVALDDHDQAITGDEIVANGGTEPFRVRIVSPRVAPHLQGRTRVVVDVKTPARAKVKTVQLYVNDRLASTMFGAPFVQSVEVPAGELGYIRAVATLDDANASQAEDAVVVNSPAQMEEVNVHLVELPTTVLAAGHVRLGLPQSSFRVYDESKPVTIAKFEEVRNLPLSIGIAIDNSGSMETRMAAARNAAAEFLRTVLRPRDRGFIVAFDSTPRILQPWSADPAQLFGALARMEARDETALHDAVVYSLYNFVGIHGQRALVLVTDGKDTASKFSYDQTLEYAHRAGVPIYTIGIGISMLDLDTRGHLSRLASETGGGAFFVGDAGSLAPAYAKIADELRSQYIIGFYPPDSTHSGSKWHEVSVRVEGGSARTIRGYYP